ncbi:MAG: hypothetical protein FWF02_07975 [Micrococcales bacterium]|nr:hypothetical protein [Micrococcales bacterium]MCL2667628.1 hypothetical protein [Micrococcales bacterium]
MDVAGFERRVLVTWVAVMLAVVPAAGCSRDDPPPVPAPPPALSPSDPSDGSPCSETTLRKARDDRQNSPLFEREASEGHPYYYDYFQVHACEGGWALVESSHSGGSTFNFWLMHQEDPTWHLVAVAGTWIDTPLDEPLFLTEELAKKGYSAEEIKSAVGEKTSVGRPVFDSAPVAPA